MSEVFKSHATDADVHAYTAAQAHSSRRGDWSRDRAGSPDEDSYADLVHGLGLARRQGRMRYLIAAVASVAWAGFLVVNAMGDGGDAFQVIAGGGPVFLLTAAGPCALAFALAAVMSRLGQSDAYILALSRATTAFMQPDEHAAERIASVSHAVRREIAAMADGLERAFSRTSELEAVVRSEIVRLERAFSENERRVGGLLRQLETERNAVVRHAESLKTALPLLQAAVTGPVTSEAGAAEAQRARLLSVLQADAERVSHEVAGAVAESAGQVLDALRVESEKALAVVTSAARRLEQHAAVAPSTFEISASAAAVEAVAREASDVLAREVRDAIAALADEMSAKAQELGGMRAGLAAVLDRSRHEFTRVLAQSAREASAEIATAHREARAALQMAIADAPRGVAVARTEGALIGSSDVIVGELAALRQLLEEADDGRVEELREQLAAHAARIEALVSGSVTQMNESVAERLKGLQALLFEQDGGLVGHFDQSHGAVVERLQEVSESIDELVQNSLSQAQATAEQLSSLVDTMGLVARARRESPAREGAAYAAREMPLISPRRAREAQARDLQPAQQTAEKTAAMPAGQPEAQGQGERAPVWLSDLLSRGPKT